MTIGGAALIGWGFTPGDYFPDAIREANRLRDGGATDQEIIGAVAGMVPSTTPMRERPLAYGVFLDTNTAVERDNAQKVFAHMDELMRVPTIRAGVVMPDACPSGREPGTIPVGGAVACEDAIHPGFHSADICCSVAITVLSGEQDPRAVLDAVHAVCHFGPGGREDAVAMPAGIRARIDTNVLLASLASRAAKDFATQGDGNHFAYVGRLASSGQTALVTHHGSRGLGAQLYTRGMALAKRHTAKVAPTVPPHNAWIKADSENGRSYWDALQIVREWTRESHYAINDLALARLGADIVDRFWNEHNFVFRREDGFY